MSMTPDAASYFQPLNYTTSFTNPAQYNYGSLQNTFNQGQQGFDASIRDIEYTQKLFQHYYEQSLFGLANMPPPSAPGTFSNYNAGGSYPTSAERQDTAVRNFVTGGGGYSFPSIPDLSGGALAGGTGPKVDFSRIFDMPAVNDFRTGGMAGGGFGGTPALDWSKMFQGGGGGQQPQVQAPKIDPYPSMQQPGGLGQPMTAQPKPQQPPIDYGSLFGKSVGGTGARAGGDTSPAIPGTAGPGWQSPLTSGPDPVKTLGYDPSKVPSASPVGPLPDVGMDPGYWKDVLGPEKPQAGASFDERFKGAPATPATPVAPVGSGALGANATPEQLIQQARDRLAKITSAAPAGGETADLPLSAPKPAAAPVPGAQQNRDELANEALKLQLPGEAGRGGMVGRPSPAEPLIEWKDGVPMPRERPAAANATPQATPATSPATEVYPGATPPRPSEDVFPARRLARSGQEPEAFIVHHTEGNPTLDSVVKYWRSGAEGRGRGLGTQYFMDRNAVIHDVREETGYTGLGQTYDANQPGTIGLNNNNIVGMEISAKNDQDVTPAQRAALVRFMAARYPDTPAYGHKEIEGGKGEAEGFTGARDILQSRPPLFNFDWSKAPIPTPAQTVADPITGRMGPNPNLGAGASAAPPRAGGFGGDEFSGKLPSPGAFTPYPGWREGGRFENRTEEQLGQDNIRALEARGTSYPVGREVPPTPLGMDLGLGDLQRQAARPAANPDPNSIEAQYRAGTLADARAGNPLTAVEMAGLRQALGEPPDINRLPVGTIDRITNALGGAAIRGFLAPGQALGSTMPVTSEDLLKPAQDMSTGYLAGAPFKEVMKNAAQTVWDTMKPVKTTTDWLWPDTSAQPPQFMDKLGPSTPAGPEPQGTPYWKIPDEGTPEWNQQVYEGRKGLGGISPRGPETVGGASSYESWPRSENVIDRRTEQLGRDELARLRATGTGIFGSMPDTAPVTPLGAAAGLETLRSTPLGQGLGRGGWAQPPAAAGDEGEEASVPAGAGPIGPRTSAFGFEPGGFGEGSYAPFQPAGEIEGEAGRGGMTGRAQLASEIAGPSDRYSDALYGRATNPVDDAIKESMTAAGLDFPTWKAIAQIESSLNPELNKDKSTQYKGLYQIGSRASNPEWAEQGMGDIYNPMDNALAAARIFQNNKEWFNARYGRDPTPGEAYLMHNQGRGFFTNNTLTNAMDNIPAGQGFTVPPTRESFLADWTRRIERGAAKYR